MSNSSKPLADVSPPHTDLAATICLFGPATRTLWALVTVFTVAPEVLPIGAMPFVLFCLYYLLKIASFLALGFLAPLAFRSLNGIGLGLLLSFLSAWLIETFQGLLHSGHVFHWYELAGKLTLIVIGFAVALDCRYEQRLSIGPVRVSLLRDK